jgi:light-harvesting complex I chlorophyll a/b binding protein 1
MALSLFSTPLAFNAAPMVAMPQPAAAAAVQMSAITPGDVGTTRPLGVYDPLGLMTKNPEKYRRFQEMEIKHGRIAMLAVLHVITTGAGYKWSGYASYLSFPPVKFEDIPAGTLASWAALPQAGWAQIVCLVAILDNSLFAQDPNLEPGDVVGDKIPWVRYSDPAVKNYKLNAERNNGRAAMMGIIGMMIHESLTGNPIWPLDYEPGKFPLIPTFAVAPGLFTIS